jgi:hypothetical protein
MSVRRGTLRSVLFATAAIVRLAIARVIGVTVVYDDLARQGPGLVLDATGCGRRILVWTD